MRTKQSTSGKQPTHKKNRFVPAVVLLGICMIAAIILFFLLYPEKKRADYKRLSSESYNAAFLSMYPIDYFYEDDFAYWRGMTLIKADYTLPSLSSIKSYLSIIGKSGNTIGTIYLGVLPEKLPADKLAALLQEYPGVHFEIILPNPSMDYWLQLTDTECANTLDAYRAFVQPLLHYDNMSLYFFGASEWLIANPANYCDGFLVSEETALTIMLNSDRDHAYLLTEKNATDTLTKLSSMIDTYRTASFRYADASDRSILFLGDSVIGNFDGNTSIPGVVAGLTGAQVFNLGNGGGKATECSDDNNSLLDIVNTVIHKDMSYLSLDMESPTESHLHAALQDYMEADLREQICFVINFGLNDYFDGCTVSSEDPYDIHTYAGAIRTSVETLKQAYPNATIILMTPNFTAYFENGTQYREDASYTLEDYADAVIALSEELDVELLDNYHELGINAKNHVTYLADGCHPNETGRFMIGQRIARTLP